LIIIGALRVRKDVRRFWERPGLFGALVDYDKTLMVLAGGETVIKSQS
jgi:hypothetical protein